VNTTVPNKLLCIRNTELSLIVSVGRHRRLRFGLACNIYIYIISIAAVQSIPSLSKRIRRNEMTVDARRGRSFKSSWSSSPARARRLFFTQTLFRAVEGLLVTSAVTNIFYPNATRNFSRRRNFLPAAVLRPKYSATMAAHPRAAHVH
jgi:hypothetical protein